ncbi:hypothetical protein HCN44_011240 [Aphidius gifuensis]|uniref:DNA-3-methyladenine glycosylase n=1 Tax=Aphidius gifuensis TaxID=684658 RepID=A0A834XW94_APHGI|nr:putative 3-methyladenine DNA glycosylase isoform X2 [Aphidius gifuensis]KAF7993971.1 hypothetical protein HCN44_011240 [Aphidius gifuensis]
MKKMNLRKRNDEGYVEKKETIKSDKLKFPVSEGHLIKKDGHDPKISRQKTSDNNQNLKDTKKKLLKTPVDLESMKDELQQLEDPPLTNIEKQLCLKRLNYDFYDTDCEKLAVNLLGKILVRHLDDGTILKGRIVETESYLGEIDKASMTYQNRVTPRNIPMYMPPGTIFVYLTYGMYHCFNISSKGKGSSVFLRAIEPLEGIEKITLNRQSKKKITTNSKPLKIHELTNGPAKLCMAFDIQKKHTKYSLCSWKGMWIENPPIIENYKIIKCPRIGIDSVGTEWASKNLRFYIAGNCSVSKRDKKAEENI